MPNYKKGEPANRSTNRKDVFTPGEIKESGSLGYMVASLMRALARSKDKKAISKLAKTPSGSSRKYPKSNVKVKKTPKMKNPSGSAIPIIPRWRLQRRRLRQDAWQLDRRRREAFAGRA